MCISFECVCACIIKKSFIIISMMAMTSFNGFIFPLFTSFDIFISFSHHHSPFINGSREFLWIKNENFISLKHWGRKILQVHFNTLYKCEIIIILKFLCEFISFLFHFTFVFNIHPLKEVYILNQANFRGWISQKNHVDVKWMNSDKLSGKSRSYWFLLMLYWKRFTYGNLILRSFRFRELCGVFLNLFPALSFALSWLLLANKGFLIRERIC